MLGAAAIPLIHTDDVEGGSPRFMPDTDHVMGIRTAFESVHQQKCGVEMGDRLPMTFGGNPRTRFDVEKPCDFWDASGRWTGPPS